MREIAKRIVVRLGLESATRSLLHVSRKPRLQAQSSPSSPAVSCQQARAPQQTQPFEMSAAERRARDHDALDTGHLRRLIAFTLKPWSNCIDVGAHRGSCLREILRIAPEGHHMAFEPIPELAAQLRQAFPSVDVHEAALSDAEGDTSFVFVPDLPGYSGLRERDYPRRVKTVPMTVRMERLDQRLPGLDRIDFIKIDVEGAEALVLKGAMRTIKRDLPLIVFEHGQGASERYGYGPRDIYELLSGDAGLRIFDLDGNGPYSCRGFEEEFASGRRWNYVARV